MPAWRRFLPRPGPWMERLQQLLAFPLYASVAWLVWVLSQQVGPPGWRSSWLGSCSSASRPGSGAGRLASPPWRRATAGGALVAVALTVATLGLVGSAAPGIESGGRAGGRWLGAVQPRLAEPARRGHPVFVNFTAAWCVTCLVNERVALRSPAVAQAFADKGVVRLRGDWTPSRCEIIRACWTRSAGTACRSTCSTRGRAAPRVGAQGDRAAPDPDRGHGHPGREPALSQL